MRFEAACLGDFLMSHANGSVDLWMKDEPVAFVRQRFAVHRNYRHASTLMQPGVRGSAAFKAPVASRENRTEAMLSD